jgi:cytolysin-activating lysine-acyltransferase
MQLVLARFDATNRFAGANGGCDLAMGSKGGDPDKTSIEALDVDDLQKLADAKGQIYSILGQVVLAMSAVPRYRYHNLADLAHLVMDPLVNDRIALASQRAGKDRSVAALAPSAVAIWATVSDEVDAKIVEQVKAGVFPVRLKPSEWNSGTITWLLDVIAPTQETATAVLTNFNKVASQEEVKVHPIVSRLVDPDILKKLAARPAGPQGASAGEAFGA